MWLFDDLLTINQPFMLQTSVQYNTW